MYRFSYFRLKANKDARQRRSVIWNWLGYCLYNLFFTTNKLLDLPQRNKSGFFSSRLLKSKNDFRYVYFRNMLFLTVLYFLGLDKTGRSPSRLTWKIAINYTLRVVNMPNIGRPVVTGGSNKRLKVLIIKKKPFPRTRSIAIASVGQEVN